MSRSWQAVTPRAFPCRCGSGRRWKECTVADRFVRAARRPPLTLVDREEELALLLHHWRHAKGGRGQVGFLEGEPAIGKSRLVVELRARLAGERHASLRYSCSPHYQASPLYPVIARLEYEARFARSDTPTDKLRKLEAVLLPAGAATEDIVLIADLLGYRRMNSFQKLNLSPQRKKQKTFEALTRRVIALAGKGRCCCLSKMSTGPIRAHLSFSRADIGPVVGTCLFS